MSLKVGRREPFLDQVCTFAGEGSILHDEFVDVISQAIGYLSDRNLLTIAPQEKPDPDPDETKAKDERDAEASRARDEGRVNPYSA